MKTLGKLVTPFFVIGMVLIFIPNFMDTTINFSWIGYIFLGLALVTLLITAFGTTAQTLKNVQGEKVEDGKLAFGRVRNSNQTGTYLNNQPEVSINLQVLLGNGQQFEKELVAVLPMQQVGMIQPGVVLPVIANEEQKVRLAQNTEATQEQQQNLLSELLLVKGLTNKEQLEISNVGTSRFAKILKIVPESTNNDQIVKVSLELELMDETNQIMNIQKKMFKSVLTDLSEGKVIEVKYSEKYPDELAMATEVKSEHLSALFDI